MTVSSGLYLYYVEQAFLGTSGYSDFTTDADMYCSLFSSSAANGSEPLYYDATTIGSGSGIGWANTDEITGTNWSTGGQKLSTAYSGSDVTSTWAITAGTPGVVTYSWTNPLEVASTTITGICGCIIYNNTATDKPCLVGVYFGGTSYATSSGTLTITPSGSGIFTINDGT